MQWCLSFGTLIGLLNQKKSSPFGRQVVNTLYVQAAGHELRTITRQDFLFGGLPLAIIDPFFFLCPPCSQLLIFWRDDRRLIPFGGAIQTVNNELRSIAR